MRIMGLDVGDKTIGIAVSDALGETAHGRQTIRRTDPVTDIRKLQKVIEENEIHKIVVGQPLHMDGRPSPQSLKIGHFARELEQATGLPLAFFDERLTSFAAEQHLEDLGMNWKKRRQLVDRMAAVLILQGYLDSQPQQS